MLHKISFRLFIWFTFVFASLFLVLNTIGIHSIQKNMINKQISFLYEEAQMISSEYSSNYYEQTSSLSNLNTQLKAIDTLLNVRIWAVNKDGWIIADTQKNSVTKNTNLNTVVPELFEQNYIKNTTLNGILSIPSLVVCHTVSSNSNIEGYVVLIQPLKNITELAQKYINIINISLLIITVILIITYIYLYQALVHPIVVLNKGAHEYANGNYSHQIKLNRKDEFSELAASITYIGTELANLEEYQKKFIANVSHDFRSPLTSIKGYAEAIKDGTIPYEMQNKYLDIILMESKRLTKLTSNLLTLNSIKHNGKLLDIISFDMNQVIKHTAQTFEVICTKKHISFQLTFETKQAMVCGDIDKIQQVVYNLIDNAIKFSPNNSTIEIGTEEMNDKLFISIKDHGIGIPTESLHKIWERFYKTDSSRGKDKGGTGLGLSIVKEIINAHGENITVASTIDVGTEFIFTLPMSEGNSLPV